MNEIYQLLNRDAKAWWYNKELRKRGEVKEARKRERESILSHVEILRNAYFATVGRGGWTIRYNHPGYLSSELKGYGDVTENIIQCAILLGIPVCDSTTISDDDIYDVVRFPMPAPEDQCDKPPYGSFSRAPITHVFKLYKNLGAMVYNLEV